MKNLTDFILIIENALSSGFCEKILIEYANCSEWTAATMSNGEQDKDRINFDIIPISNEDVIAKDEFIRKQIDLGLFEITNKVIKEYVNQFPDVMIEKDLGYDLVRFGTGQFYSNHIDSAGQMIRTISCHICLNDDYDGGEIEFWNKEHKIKPKQGTIILYPSNFMFPSSIAPVTKGLKYSILTFFV